jgi:hypothetical protein
LQALEDLKRKSRAADTRFPVVHPATNGIAAERVGFFDQEDGKPHAGGSQRGANAPAARPHDAEIIFGLAHQKMDWNALFTKVGLRSFWWSVRF